MAKKFKLSPPWITFYHDLNEMFGNDPDIKLDIDEDEYVVRMYVEDADKADALSKILPTEKVFGNVTVRIKVIPANAKEESIAELFKKAFKGNPILADALDIIGAFDFRATYVVFAKKVVQYFNDDMGDINGLRSTLYEDIARDMFSVDGGVFFCTDTEDPLKKPLGEWP